MAKAKAKFPATIYVYEEESDPAFLVVANGMNEISEDQDGAQVATYSLTQVRKFKIKRDLV